MTKATPPETKTLIIADARSGMSQQQLAAKHGVSQVTVSNILRKEGLSRGRGNALLRPRVTEAAPETEPTPVHVHVPTEEITPEEAARVLGVEIHELKAVVRFFRIAPVADGNFRADLVHWVLAQRDLARDVQRLKELNAVLFPPPKPKALWEPRW